MKEIALKPNYLHSVAEKVKPPKTNLTFGIALPFYEKLKNYLGFEIYAWAPASWLDGENKRDLFETNGFHHRVRWQPKLKKGWRRLEFYEFCIWYGIPIILGG